MIKKVLLIMLFSSIVVNMNAKELKVLMIGNSFSQSVLTYLPQIVKTEGKHKLILAQLYIGGCTLERHIKELTKAENDPKYKPYSTNYPQRKKVALPDMINLEKWDIITIQQGSIHSWQLSKTQPFADTLIAYIRKHAPQAEIVIHQTWAYRSSSPQISGTKPKWGINQTEMYNLLTKNYTALAQKYQFRIIPVGKGVQLFRAVTPIKFVAPSQEELKSYVYPNLPSSAGDVVGVYKWRKNQKTGEQILGGDHIHLNKAGEYLQACIWYGFLFNEDSSKIKYTPKNMDINQAKLLRICAQDALKSVSIL